MNIKKEDFIKSYLEDDLTYEQLCEKFNLKRNQVADIVKSLGLSKSSGRKKGYKLI